jgi:lysophospholipase L1-like esterase
MFENRKNSPEKWGTFLLIQESTRLRLLTLTVLLLYLSLAASAQQEKPQTANKFESEILAFEKLDKEKHYSDQSILFVGSSSIRLWSTLEEQMAPYPVIQRGFGGSRTPDVLQYIERIAYPHQFRAMVLFVANDLTGSPNDLKPEETLNNFREIVKTIREKYRKQPIFIVEITPCLSRWKVWTQIQQDNALLKSYCKKGKNLYFIETAESYLNEKGEPRDELFREDHLHQNAEGYKIWGKLIKDKLDAVMK